MEEHTTSFVAISASKQIKKIYRNLVNNACCSKGEVCNYSMLYCQRILEHFDAVILLLEGGFFTQAAIIGRSMLECMVTLINLTGDPKYLQQLMHKNADEKNRLATSLIDNDIIPLSQLDCERYNRMIVHAQETINALSKTQNLEKKIFAGFKRAKLVNEYNTYYSWLSSFAHNQIAIISPISGHPEKSRRTLTINKFYTNLLTLCLSMLGTAIRILPKFTDSKQSTVDASVSKATLIWESTNLAQ